MRETAYYVHIVLALHLPGLIVGYYLSAFYVQCLTVAGVSQPSFNVAREFEFRKNLKVIRCCLGSPSKSCDAHPHVLASLTQPFVIKFKLHSFQECFSWQTKSRIYD